VKREIKDAMFATDLINGNPHRNRERQHCPVSPAGGGQSGMTIVEFMVGLTIGLVMVMALATLFAMNSFSFSETEKSNRQIENGRYATEVLTEDIRHAGFYGATSNLGALPATPRTRARLTLATLVTALPIAIYGIDAPDATPSCLPDYVSGTDVLVIRRSNTTEIDAAAAVANGYYTQVSFCRPSRRR